MPVSETLLSVSESLPILEIRLPVAEPLLPVSDPILPVSRPILAVLEPKLPVSGPLFLVSESLLPVSEEGCFYLENEAEDIDESLLYFLERCRQLSTLDLQATLMVPTIDRLCEWQQNFKIGTSSR